MDDKLIIKQENALTIRVDVDTKPKQLIGRAKETSKVSYIDAIRGIAAMQVALYHAMISHQEAVGFEFHVNLRQSRYIISWLSDLLNKQCIHSLFCLEE